MIDKFSEFLLVHKKLLLCLTLALTVVFPFVFTSQYVIRIATIALMYVVLTLSLNLISGMMGQVSFGHSAFFGIGAYAAALTVTRTGLGAEVSFLAAILLAGVFGALLGLPVLRLKGYYFTIVTMVFCEIIRIVELNWMSVTRGPLGIMAIGKPSFFGFTLRSQTQLYFLAVILVAVAYLVVHNIMNSRIGNAIMAIRDDELAASSMGINVFKYKVMVFVIASMLAGLAGAFYAQYTGYIDPTNFSSVKSNEMLLMVIFGGLGNAFGSFVGAIVLTIIPELLRGLSIYRQLIYGGLLVLLMMVRPQGLFGSVNFKYLGQRMGMGAKEQKGGETK